MWLRYRTAVPRWVPGKGGGVRPGRHCLNIDWRGCELGGRTLSRRGYRATQNLKKGNGQGGRAHFSSAGAGTLPPVPAAPCCPTCSPDKGSREEIDDLLASSSSVIIMIADGREDEGGDIKAAYIPSPDGYRDYTCCFRAISMGDASSSEDSADGFGAGEAPMQGSALLCHALEARGSPMFR